MQEVSPCNPLQELLECLGFADVGAKARTQPRVINRGDTRTPVCGQANFPMVPAFATYKSFLKEGAGGKLFCKRVFPLVVRFRKVGIMDNLGFSQLDDIALKLAGLDLCGAFMAFSLRSGGVSPRPYDSLNFSAEEGDSVENVQQNCRIFGERLGIDSQRIVTPRQVHGDQVVILDGIPSLKTTSEEADAIITTTAAIYPAVKTADCVPLLLIDPVRGISAVVHVGWRGAVS